MAYQVVQYLDTDCSVPQRRSVNCGSQYQLLLPTCRRLAYTLEAMSPEKLERLTSEEKERERYLSPYGKKYRAVGSLPGLKDEEFSRSSAIPLIPMGSIRDDPITRHLEDRLKEISEENHLQTDIYPALLRDASELISGMKSHKGEVHLLRFDCSRYKDPITMGFFTAAGEAPTLEKGKIYTHKGVCLEPIFYCEMRLDLDIIEFLRNEEFDGWKASLRKVGELDILRSTFLQDGAMHCTHIRRYAV